MENKKEAREANENLPYYSPAPEGEFPIVGSTLAYNKSGDYDIVEEKDMRIFNSCGFNVVLKNSLSFGGGKDNEGNQIPAYFEESLKNAEKIKDGQKICLRMIIGNSYFGSKDSSHLNWLDKYYSFGGIFLKDEPKMDEITATCKSGMTEEACSKLLISRYDKIKDNYKDKLIYINLVGGPVGNFMEVDDANPQKSYRDYVEAFQDNFKPSFFCYDLYPITEVSRLFYEGTNVSLSKYDGKSEGQVEVGYSQFYTDLELFNRMSQGSGRPFWAFCESMSYINLGNSALYRPVALEQYLRFEAFSAIAYGAKGIAYWTYGMRRNGIDDKTNKVTESYISALLDRRDRKTASWYYAQKVNAEIKKYGTLLMNAEFIECRHTGNLEGYEKEVIPVDLNGFEPFKSIKSDKESGVIISVFTKSITEYYLVLVSKDVLEYQNIELEYDGLGELKELTPLKSNVSPDNSIIKATKIIRILPPGGYRIFQWNPNIIIKPDDI